MISTTIQVISWISVSITEKKSIFVTTTKIVVSNFNELSSKVVIIHEIEPPIRVLVSEKVVIIHSTTKIKVKIKDQRKLENLHDFVTLARRNLVEG